MDTEQHMGYTNYATALIAMWWDNDGDRPGVRGVTKGAYTLSREIVRVAHASQADSRLRDVDAADALKAFVETRIPDDLPAPASDMINAGMADVNWMELARDIATELAEG